MQEEVPAAGGGDAEADAGPERGGGEAAERGRGGDEETAPAGGGGEETAAHGTGEQE